MIKRMVNRDQGPDRIVGVANVDLFQSSSPAGVQRALFAGVVVSILLSPLANAVAPERFPSYSHTRLLRADATLRAIVMVDDRNGVACGDRGTILITDDGGQSWTMVDSGVDCRLSDVARIDDQSWIIVGGGYDRITRISRAIVLISQDQGQTWRHIAVDDLPALKKVERRRDGTLMAVGDWSHSLLADQFQSHDHGKTWLANHDSASRLVPAADLDPEQLAHWAAATKTPVAIRDACKIGASTRLAVGDHGVILISSDDGRTWKPSRGAENQTGILMVARDRESVAWGLLGKEAIEHRNRVSLLVAQSHHDAPGLVDQVAVMLGGSGADAVLSAATVSSVAKLRSSALIAAADQWIAVHRPSVLLLDQTMDVQTQDAFIQAATAASVARVVVYHAGSGQTVIHRDALLPKSGVLVSDLMADANQFVAPHREAATSIALQFRYDVASSARRGDSVTGGILLSPGQTLTASLPAASRHQLQILQARRTQTARITKLIDAPQAATPFTETLAGVLNSTARDDQFRLAWSIFLETCKHSGNAKCSTCQQASLDQIATRFAGTSAGHWARLISDSRNHSAEWIRVKRAVVGGPEIAESANAVVVSPFQQPGSEIRQVSAIAPLLVPKPETIDYQSHDSQTVRGVDLSWEFHPLVLIAREASRQRGDDGQLRAVDGSSSELKRLAESREPRWSPLVRHHGTQTLVAHRTPEPPKLDGILNDPCWESALMVAAETRIRFAYDQEFVYVAFETSSNKLRPDSAANPALTQMRDRDLSGVDHLLLKVDIDRDLLTCFQFAVSPAGQTSDGVDGNLSWNPSWYRETRSHGGRITMELAVLRRDLVDLPIREGECWYVSSQLMAAGQTVPGPIIPNPSEWMRVEFR